MDRIRRQLTYANVMSTIAVFLVLGGGAAFAAGQLAKNSVGAKQLKKEAVTGAKIRNAAVGTAKIADAAVTGSKVDEATLGQVPDSARLGGSAASAFAHRGPAPFHTVTTLNGWSATSVTTPPGYWVDEEGTVHLQGVVTSGASGTTAFILPEAVWPTHNVIYLIFCPSGGGVGILNIFQQSGHVDIADASGSNCSSQAHLEGVTYRPDL